MPVSLNDEVAPPCVEVQVDAVDGANGAKAPRHTAEFDGGKRGTTYPDRTWEPKASFRAVATYYGAAR